MITLLFIIFNIGNTEIIASSSIETCYQSTTNSSDCSEKMLISLTVGNSQNISTEYIKINTTTLDNDTLSLKTPVIISVTKTPVYAYYPLTYNQDYNSKPYETKIGGSIISCDDSWYSSSPTCGFQYSNGSKIFDSQGFCCSCGILDIIGLTDEYARGNICSEASLTTASMAFCLRWSDLWYSSYYISTYSLYYNITVSITYSNGDNEQLKLGADVTVAQGTSLIARIIGDFTPLSPPPSLESYYLMKPTSPSTNERVTAGSSEYMIISKELVGTGECNKIGVTYSSFRTESDRCSKKVNSCLNYQIEDYHSSDQVLIANSSQPLYMLSRYGTFAQVTVSNDTFLRYTVEGSMSTVITLEINTTGLISYITNVGNATIDFAEIQNFEAQSGDGLLYAQITNIGEVSSEFSTYLNCSINVIPINSVSLYLDPLVSQVISQSVNVLSDMNKSNQCNFSLLNSIGELLDYIELTFNTTEVITNSSQTHDEQTTQDGEVLATDETTSTCDSECSIFYDIECYITNSCDSEIITFFTVIVVTLLFISLLFSWYGYQKKICKICCCCCKKDQQFQLEIKHIANSIKNKINKSSIISQTSNKSLIDKKMYINLHKSTDPISTYLNANISFSVMATLEGNKVEQLQLSKRSPFIQVFQEIYGQHKLFDNIKKYLQNKKESCKLFNSLLTDQPLYTIL